MINARGKFAALRVEGTAILAIDKAEGEIVVLRRRRTDRRERINFKTNRVRIPIGGVEMNADENGILLRIRDARAQFQRNKDVALARHDDLESFRFEQRSQLTRNIEREIFFASVTAARAFVVTAMAGIEHDRLHFAEVRDHLRTQLRLQSFREIDARDEQVAILLDYGKREPVAHAVDHDFATVEARFQFVATVAEPHFFEDRIGDGQEGRKNFAMLSTLR